MMLVFMLVVALVAAQSDVSANAAASSASQSVASAAVAPAASVAAASVTAASVTAASVAAASVTAASVTAASVSSDTAAASGSPATVATATVASYGTPATGASAGTAATVASSGTAATVASGTPATVASSGTAATVASSGSPTSVSASSAAPVATSATAATAASSAATSAAATAASSAATSAAATAASSAATSAAATAASSAAPVAASATAVTAASSAATSAAATAASSAATSAVATAASSAATSAAATAASSAATSAAVTSATAASAAATSAPTVDIRALVISRSLAAIADADKEIAANPAETERFNARKARLQSLVDCLRVATNDVQVCHQAYEASHAAYVQAHQDKIAALEKQVAALVAQRDACSDKDDEEACVAPLKIAIRNARLEIVKARLAKEKNALHPEQHRKGRCARGSDLKKNFIEFSKVFKERSVMVAADPVDVEALRLSKLSLEESMKTYHDQVAAQVNDCALIKDEPGSVRCRMRIEKQLLALRRRAQSVTNLFACASTSSDVTARGACVKKVRKELNAQRPRTSASCKRRRCRKSFGKFKKIVKSVSASASDAVNVITTALSQYSDKRTALDGKLEDCRRLSSSARRSRCSAAVRSRLRVLRKRIRVLRRLEECNTHVDAARRTKCLRSARHDARKSNNCPHSRTSCKSQTVLRKEYRKFLATFKNAVKELSKPTATTDSINAVVEGMASTLVAQANGEASQKDACAKLTASVARRSCFRAHRRSHRALRRRQRNVNRLRRCGRLGDAIERGRCARRLSRDARKATPKSCQHTKKSCSVQNERLTRFGKFVKTLKALKKVLDVATDFDVLSKRYAAKTKEAEDRVRARCEALTDETKRRRCTRALDRRVAGNVKRAKIVAELQRCQDFSDRKTRSRCARKILKSVAQKAPKRCHKNVCARKNKALRRYLKFEESLKSIAKLVSAPTVSVHDVNSAASALNARARNSARPSRKCRQTERASSSRRCQRAAERAARHVRRLVGLVDRVQNCASETDPKRRAECASRAINRARSAQPRPCQKSLCKRKNKARKNYVRFLADVNSIVKISNTPTATSVDVAAATTKVTARNQELETRVGTKRERCKKITNKRRRARCLKRVRAKAKALSKERRIVERLTRCAQRTEVKRRARCNRRVVRQARRDTPRRCTTKISKTKKTIQQIKRVHRSVRRRAKRAVRELTSLAESISRPDFSVSTFDKSVADMEGKINVRLAELKLRRSKCNKRSNRKVCLRRVRSNRRLARRSLRNIKRLNDCRKSADPKKCIARLLRRARKSVPRKQRTRAQCKRLARRRRAAKKVLRMVKKGDAKRLQEVLSARQSRLTRREARCRRIESTRRQAKCLKRVVAARNRLNRAARLSERLSRCVEHVDESKRKKCQKRLVRKSRRSVPKPCQIRRTKCTRMQAARSSHQRFLSSLRAVVSSVSADPLNQQLLTASVTEATERNGKSRRGLARKLKRCGKSSRCRRHVRKQQKAVVKRSKAVRVAAACASQTTALARKQCATKVLQKAARRMPKGCKANKARRIRALRHQYRRFIRGAKRLASLVTATPQTTPADLKRGLDSELDTIGRQIKRLRRKLKRCRESPKCLRRIRKQLNSVKREHRKLKALFACSTGKDDKTKCVARVMRSIRRNIPRPPRSKSACNKQKRMRKRYAAFASKFRALVDVLSLPGEVNAANVTTLTAEFATVFAETDSKVEKKLRKCADLSVKRAVRCHRQVRRARRQVARRRALVDRASACAKETDDSKRLICARSALRVVVKGTPRRCRRSTNCPKKKLEISAFRQMLSRVQAVATNLTNVDAALTDVETQVTAAVQAQRDCAKVTSRRRRRSCSAAQRKAVTLVSREKKALTELKACATNTDLDADKQAACANSVVVILSRRRPRNCAVRKRVSLHPRQKVVKLRRRLTKCKTVKCRTHVNSLIRIQLQSLIERRHRRRARHAAEVARRQVLYGKIAACGEDAACRLPLRRELAQLYQRSTRRRARRLASLTQLRKLQKRLTTCRKDGEGEVCRRAVIEDYRSAIQDLAKSMDEALRQEAVRAYKVALRSCATNVDVPVCRTTATQVFVDRVTALAVDAAQMQYLTATRMCAFAPDGAACVDAAKAARDQDIAIQKDEASSVASLLQKRIK